MSQEMTANQPPSRLRSSAAIWLAALVRPSIATYAALGQQPRISAWRAYMWIFAGGLIGAAISSLAPFESQLVERGYVDTLLVALIPISSLIAVCYLAAFTWCTHRVARLYKGSGTYPQLAYVFAAFSAPLLVAASILDLIPPTRVLLVVLYLYWIALYWVAVRAVNRISPLKAIAVVLGALLILGCAWLGVVFLVGYSGVLLP
jgi:Yip1 domain